MEFVTGRWFPVSCPDTCSVGIFLDLIECLIQRDFGYATRDARVAYTHIKEALLEESLTKIIIVAHSQGGIVISMVLDNLLADLPRECTIILSPAIGDSRFQKDGDLYIRSRCKPFQ